jgi:hypothetical protein
MSQQFSARDVISLQETGKLPAQFALPTIE